MNGTNIAVIFMGDICKRRTQWDFHYFLMPLGIGGGRLWLPDPEPWTIALKTGGSGEVRMS